jgi:hypothetical protein
MKRTHEALDPPARKRATPRQWLRAQPEPRVQAVNHVVSVLAEVGLDAEPGGTEASFTMGLRQGARLRKADVIRVLDRIKDFLFQGPRLTFFYEQCGALSELRKRSDDRQLKRRMGDVQAHGVPKEITAALHEKINNITLHLFLICDGGHSEAYPRGPGRAKVCMSVPGVLGSELRQLNDALVNYGASWSIVPTSDGALQLEVLI